MSCEGKNCYALNPRSFKGCQRRKSYLLNVTLEGIGDTTCLSFIYYSSVKYMYTTYEVYV